MTINHQYHPIFTLNVVFTYQAAPSSSAMNHGALS